MAKRGSAKSTRKTKRKSMNRGTTSTTATTVATKKLTSVKDPLTKSGMIKALTDATGLTKKNVVSVMDNFATLIELHIRSRGPGKFVLPGLLKISVVKKAARPARKGINPFTGEPTTFKAKPAHKVVKVKALRKLKEMATA